MRSSIGIDSTISITDPTDENTGDIKIHPSDIATRQLEAIEGIHSQLKRLNAMFESEFRTSINLEDVTNED